MQESFCKLNKKRATQPEATNTDIFYVDKSLKLAETENDAKHLIVKYFVMVVLS